MATTVYSPAATMVGSAPPQSNSMGPPYPMTSVAMDPLLGSLHSGTVEVSSTENSEGSVMRKERDC